jgi:benzoate membrane transport protein
MRSFSLPLPTLLAGFIAVLVGYASSAAIIWQAAASAGASASQIAGWMTALGLGWGSARWPSRYGAKCRSSPPGQPRRGAAGQRITGVTLNQAVGVFIFANALMVLCGLTGLFARLMKIIPHSLAAAMLAGILLRFGLQAFATLEDHLLLCGGMLAAWLLCKALYPRFAVVAALLVGGAIAVFSGDVVGTTSASLLSPRNISRRSLPLRCCSASACRSSWSPWPRKTPRFRHDAGFRLSGARVAADCRHRRPGADTVAFWRLLHLYCRHYRRHLPKSGGPS